MIRTGKKGTSALSSPKKWRVAAVDLLDVEGRESYEDHQRNDQDNKSSAREFTPDENYGCDARGEHQGDCTVLPNVLITPGNDQHDGRSHNRKEDRGGVCTDRRKTRGHVGHLQTLGPGSLARRLRFLRLSVTMGPSGAATGGSPRGARDWTIGAPALPRASPRGPTSDATSGTSDASRRMSRRTVVAMSRHLGGGRKASQDPRQHHIVPAFYLAGFTRTMSVHGSLWVFRYDNAAHFRTSPKKACRERDYFRFVDQRDRAADAYYMEHLLAWHEGAVAPFVKQLAIDARVTDRKQIAEAISLAAALIGRGRQARRRLELTLATSVIKALRDETVTREEWDRYRADELANDADDNDCPEYDVARDRALRGDWRPRAPRAVLIGLIPEAQERLMKMLSGREWELMITNADATGGFVTSDSPVVWGDLERAAVGSHARLDDPGVEITFPVSKDAALVAYDEAQSSNSVATPEIVAHVNARTVHMTDGMIMHSHDDFLIRQMNGEIGNGSEYFDYIRESKRRGSCGHDPLMVARRTWK